MNKEKVLKDYTGLIYTVCDSFKYSVDNLYDIDDLYQECCMKLYDVLDKYNPKYSLTTFIFIVCRNMLITLKDKERLITINGYDFDRFMVKQDSYSNEELDLIEKAERILRNYKHKDIVVRILYGETQTSIAKSLGVSRQYVSKTFLDFIRKI